MAIVRAHDVPAAVLGTAVYNASKDQTDAVQLVNSLRAAQDNAQQMRQIQAQQQAQAASQAFQGQQNAQSRYAQMQDRQNQYAQQAAQNQWQATYQKEEFDRRAATDLDQYREKQQLETAGYKEKLTMQQKMRRQELEQGIADVMNPAATPNYTPQQRERLRGQLQAEYHGIKGVFEPETPNIDDLLKNNVRPQPDGSNAILQPDGSLDFKMPPGKNWEADRDAKAAALQKSKDDARYKAMKDIADLTLKLRDQSVNRDGVIEMKPDEARRQALEMLGIKKDPRDEPVQESGQQPAQPAAPQPAVNPNPPSASPVANPPPSAVPKANLFADSAVVPPGHPAIDEAKRLGAVVQVLPGSGSVSIPNSYWYRIGGNADGQYDPQQFARPFKPTNKQEYDRMPVGTEHLNERNEKRIKLDPSLPKTVSYGGTDMPVIGMIRKRNGEVLPLIQSEAGQQPTAPRPGQSNSFDSISTFSDDVEIILDPNRTTPFHVSSIEQAKRLPPGTRFIDTNGEERVR